MRKEDLRSKYKQLRQHLTTEEKYDLDQKIYFNLTQFNWPDYRNIHVYLPISKFNEPDTLQFVKWIWVNHPSINIVVSRSDFATGVMNNYILDNLNDLVENRWGILEPHDGKRIDDNDIDFVLVPLLIVDVLGNRVGYGKGFYDRFLANCRPDIDTYGISYFEPVPPIVDVGDWDIKLKGCITPDKIYAFT